MIEKGTGQSEQKETIQWFTFHYIVDHTAGIIETDI